LNALQRLCAVVVVLVLIAACSSAADDFDTALHEADVLAWQESRRASLMAPTGFLNLAGLFWLEKETSTFGSSPDNDLVFPAAADPHIGEFHLIAAGHHCKNDNCIVFIMTISEHRSIFNDEVPDRG